MLAPPSSSATLRPWMLFASTGSGLKNAFGGAITVTVRVTLAVAPSLSVTVSFNV